MTLMTDAKRVDAVVLLMRMVTYVTRVKVFTGVFNEYTRANGSSDIKH